MYETGRETAQDYVRASQLYERACASGDVTGCYNLGVLLEIGLGVPEDQARASALYEQACQGSYQRACARLESK